MDITELYFVAMISFFWENYTLTINSVFLHNTKLTFNPPPPQWGQIGWCITLSTCNLAEHKRTQNNKNFKKCFSKKFKNPLWVPLWVDLDEVWAIILFFTWCSVRYQFHRQVLFFKGRISNSQIRSSFLFAGYILLWQT